MGLTIWVISTSLAATSCSMGVKRKKFSRFMRVASTFGTRDIAVSRFSAV
jgi:hypothetical protein